VFCVGVVGFCARAARSHGPRRGAPRCPLRPTRVVLPTGVGTPRSVRPEAPPRNCCEKWFRKTRLCSLQVRSARALR
jgi:hypothetical protein